MSKGNRYTKARVAGPRTVCTGFGGAACASSFGRTQHLLLSYVLPVCRLAQDLHAMDLSSVELRTNMLDWDEGNVHLWLTTLGLPQYENQIRRAFVAHIATESYHDPDLVV